MVLTQPLVGGEPVPQRTVVSIPLWFLRNCVRFPPAKVVTGQFPYHYGSYATKPPTNSEMDTSLFSFHTTMVLTQLTSSFTEP